MRRQILAIATLMSLCAVCLVAQDGATTYKKKCAGCHGANAEGKPAMKAPALKGVDSAKIVQQITKGSPQAKAPHNKAMSGVTEQDATAIADYIKTLQ